MTSRAELLQLADRVEREEPSAALSMVVLQACGWSRPNGSKDNTWHHSVHGWRSGGPDPLYSLDAAATLVPDGASWYAGKTGDAGVGRVYVDQGKDDARMFDGDAATPAPALTAAALRARALEARDE